MFSICLEGITKSYDRPVLKNINMNIKSDSFIAIVGKSGSGKSTLMNIVGLIEKFNKGKYVFCGREIEHDKDYANLRNAHIGFIYQSYNLIPNLTCRENILLPLLYSNKKATDFDSLTKELGISEILDVSVNVLSGGEKQRVAIARALITDPDFIIADEPTGNLDNENGNIVIDVLLNENKKGKAVLIITHDSIIADKARTLYELFNGELHEKTR
jgi:putative ABC transport system ATP-binding protein